MFNPPDTSPETLTTCRRTLMDVADKLMRADNMDRAETVLNAALVMIDDEHALSSPDVGQILLQLGTIEQLRRDYQHAERHYRLAILVYSLAFGSDHPNVNSCRERLASVLWQMGRFSEAREFSQPERRPSFDAVELSITEPTSNMPIPVSDKVVPFKAPNCA